MTTFWRVLLTVYNILMIVIASAVLAASFSVFDPQPYLQAAFNEQNRLYTTLTALLLLLLAVDFLIQSWRSLSLDDGIVVREGLQGQVTMTVAAIKLMIMKSLRQIEGIREVRPEISKDKTGLTVKLHMMIIPELNVPEVTAKAQQLVKEHLESVGGLQVNAVKVKIDDFKAGK
ncbi:MAG TPA: alkaline shock response membrane anchor protein AmaP [Syntrophomonas sp.]|nr:alkaline shock response membrane anchor protein AmaP [Syntrophomonas sp.]